jgi:hypothetical protein
VLKNNSQEQSLSPKDVDGPRLVVDGHLVVEDEVWTAHGSRVVRDHGPAGGDDVVHEKVALEKGERKLLLGIAFFANYLCKSTIFLVSTVNILFDGFN